MKNSPTVQKDSSFILQVNEPDKVLNFLTERMGFTVAPADILQTGTSKGNLKCIALRNSYGNQYLLPVNNANSRVNKSMGNNTIVINTDDCLREYYNLRKVEEIAFYGKPKYLPEGLAFEAADKWGNGYILLEKRNYTDN